MTDREFRTYLLGDANEADAEPLEVRLLEDEGTFATLRSVEDDLFDDYARGTLTDDQRRRFLERYGGERHRLLLAQALTKRLARRHFVLTRFDRRYWIPAAAAATLAAGIGLSLLTRRQTTGPDDAVRDALSRPLPAAVLIVSLGTSRSDSTVPEIALAAGTPALELHVRLNPMDRFDAYSMELRTESGTLAWRADNLHAFDSGGDLVVVGAVPTKAIAIGSYELAVRGSTGSSSEEILGFATVNIRR